MKELWKKGIAGEQRGAFIVFTALALWFLMMFVAFAVDFGNYYQHRSRLQNTADAAALAGVARYVKEESAKNNPSASKVTMGHGRLVGDKAVPDKSTAEDVDDYIQSNYANRYGSLSQKAANAWSETPEDGKETTHHYCRVDLEDTIPTFFARIFGLNELDVKVSAVAMLDETAEQKKWGQRLAGIAERLELLAPNLLWESLRINDNNTSQAFKITDLRNPSTPTEVSRTGYGSGANRYYAIKGVSDYLLGKENTRQKHPPEDEGPEIIIGYKDPATSHEDYGICAVPIYVDAGITWKDLTDYDDKFPIIADPSGVQDYRRYCPTTKVFDIVDSEDTEGVTRHNGKEIFALYLNRDHILQRTGLSDRFTKINVGCIMGVNRNTVTNDTGVKTSYQVPLFARLESETIRSGAKALMPIHGVWIEVKATQTELGMDTGKLDEDGNPTFTKSVRPLVLAYDGPDPNRGSSVKGRDSDDREDAPWIATRYTDLNKITYSTEPKDPEILFSGNTKRDYYPSEIRKYFEDPLLRNSKYNYPTKPEYLEHRGLVRSALKSSGPIYVTIEDGCVFYGNIYAPNSKVFLTIKGSGCIYGFIAARKIEYNGGNVTHEEETTTLPKLVVSEIKWSGTEIRPDYERIYDEHTYQVVYTYLADFTEGKYYRSFFGTDDKNLKKLNNWN